MSKGSHRRPLDKRYCDEKQLEENWKKAFPKPKPPEIKNGVNTLADIRDTKEGEK